MAKLSSDPLLAALEAVGIGDENTTRVVIDVRAGHLPVVYIEQWGDDRLLQVVQTLEGVEITRDVAQTDENPVQPKGQPHPAKGLITAIRNQPEHRDRNKRGSFKPVHAEQSDVDGFGFTPPMEIES